MAKRKRVEADEFDDSFVDRDGLSKTPNSFEDGDSGDLSDGETEDGDEPKEILIDVVVLNVDITGTDDCRTLRFDTLEHSTTGVRYSSRYYGLDFAMGTNGVFDMLDDYFVGRFRFLHSSKSCQEFLTAMADVEEGVRKKTGVGFFELCKRMNGDVLDSIDGGVDIDGTILWDGYGISNESLSVFKSKRGCFDGFDFKWLNGELVKRFNFYREYVETKHFCAFCIQHNGELVFPNIIEEPELGIPLLVFIPRFGKLLCEKVAHEFLSSSVFQDLGIDEMHTDLYLLMPKATLADIKTLYSKSLKIKDFDGIEDKEFVTGKYKTLTFSEEAYSDREETLDSMIGFA